MNPIHNELTQLLNNLDVICETAEEVADSEVRDNMGDVIFHNFIKPNSNYETPVNFGMFSGKGNLEVSAVLTKFIESVKNKIGTDGLSTPQERLNSFQDDNLTSDDGMYYDDYFGESELITAE